jgi:hypothetical protein
MIKEPDVAKQISETMKRMWNELMSCFEVVRERCSPEEYQAFRKATKNIGCGIVFDVMEPLYDAHPNLKPPNWDDVPGGGGFCEINKPL